MRRLVQNCTEERRSEMKKKGWDAASFGPDGTASQRADDAGKRLSSNRNPLGEKNEQV